MRWCRFEHGGKRGQGIVEDDEVVVVEGDMLGEHRRTGERHAVERVNFLPPVVPSTFFCVGLNYAAHISHAAQSGYTQSAMPQRPDVGYRANSALIGHGAPIVKPADCAGRFEAEGELVAVIGQRTRHCSIDQAREAIFGWTIGNDVSARDWQHSDRTLWRAKNSDTFKPMGPWIETEVDPMTATTSVAVNSDVVAKFPTGAMIFDPFEYICEISRYITMLPGDVLWMGTDAGVEMKPGDTIGITISGIGTLANPVVAEPSSTTEENR
jgi:2-keto-4-pentenoate hydratase/2-oxohepta-3-ene-1,7-dioic acid hydratase in catechol pathway